MKVKKFNIVLIVLLVTTLFSMPTIEASYFNKNYYFGNSESGASLNEFMQIRYTGASWNYRKNGKRTTCFKFVRNNRTLESKCASGRKVKASVWDDLRWGSKYTTHFKWYER